MASKSWRWPLLLLLVFLALGAATRFYRIDWSFSDDDTSSLAEARSLVEKPFFLAQVGYHDQQPRAQPVSHLLQAGAFRLFGESEAGARTGGAIAGTLSILLTVLLVYRLAGGSAAVILGAALMLWPWHLGHSQSTRVYMYAFLFVSVSLLSAALAWDRNSMKWGALSGMFSALAVSSHLSAILLPLGLTGFVAAECLRHRNPLAKRALLGYVLVGGPLLVGSCFLGWLAMHAWAGQQDWGYSVPHTVFGLAYNLGWSFALLSVIGWMWAWRRGRALDRMCASVAAVAFIASIICPSVVSFRPDYLFTVTLAFMVLASGTIAVMYGELRKRSLAFAAGTVAVLLALPVPSFLSYYQDGDRQDYRAAAHFIEEHRQTGDIVAADNPGALGYYLAVPVEGVSSKCVEALESLSAGSKRVWYVCRYAREEPPGWVDQWFWQHAVRMLRLKKARFDYHENILDVYLIGAKQGTSKAERGPDPPQDQTREDASTVRPQKRNLAGIR